MFSEKDIKEIILCNENTIIIKPPKPIKQNFYKCDKILHLQTINNMYGEDFEHENIGFSIINGENITLYLSTLINRKLIETKKILSYDWNPQKKQKKGGQSAQRIGRKRENKIDQFIKLSCELVIDNLLCYKLETLVIVGESLNKKKLYDKLVKENIIESNKILLIQSSEKNVEKLFNDCKDKIITNRDIESELKQMIELNSDKLVFGKKEVKHELKNNMLQKIMIDRTLYDIIKEKINKTNNYNCEIEILDEKLFMYDGIVGIKFY
jgi:peptide subunit release factor 1 (eRF1)